MQKLYILKSKGSSRYKFIMVLFLFFFYIIWLRIIGKYFFSFARSKEWPGAEFWGDYAHGHRGPFKLGPPSEDWCCLLHGKEENCSGNIPGFCTKFLSLRITVLSCMKLKWSLAQKIIRYWEPFLHLPIGDFRNYVLIVHLLWIKLGFTVYKCWFYS